MEKGLTKTEIISTLTKAVHAGGVTKRKKGEKAPKLTWDEKKAARTGALTKGYVNLGATAVHEDENFFAHLIAWNHSKGEVRDAKVALPVIGLVSQDSELLENALAHMADLRPREFLRAVEFARSLGGTRKNVVRRLTERYLRDLEANVGEWERTALLHRNTLRTLYSIFHTKPVEWANNILFKGQYAKGSRFQRVKDLSKLDPLQIAGTIRELKLPWLIIKAALGAKLKDPDILAAAIGGMTAAEVVTNMKTLEKLGVKENPITRAALEEAIGKATSRQQTHKATLKASVAAEALEASGDEQGANKLRLLQEKQLDAVKGIEGNWLVCADKSSSMSESIEGGKQVAATLARLVRGKVYLVFFNTGVTFYDVTGMSLEEIKKLTRHESASGGTLIGTPVDWAREKGLAIDGIALVTDGGDNRPGNFATAYQKYVEKFGNEPTVYFFKMSGDPDRLTGTMDEIQVFDIRGGFDYTSLPNLVQTMRVGRFTLLDEVMSVKLRTLDEALDRTKGVKVLTGQEAVYA